MQPEPKPGRAILWAVPRSISTAFYRAMMNKKTVKTLMEPYSNAYYFGHERVSQRYANEPSVDNAAFLDVRGQYEAAAEQHSQVFVKDMAYYVFGNQLSPHELLPWQYTHTFLIREPLRCIKSLYKMSVTSQLTGWSYFDPAEVGFRELWKLYKLVRNTTNTNPVVISAEDLILKPEPVLKFYCEHTGITYGKEMLEWDATDGSDQEFGTWKPWFEGVLSTNTFVKQRAPFRRQKSIELPPDVEVLIRTNDKYYQKLKKFTVNFD